MDPLPTGLGPDMRRLYGRTVNLVALDVSRHGRDLYEAYSGDDSLWNYMGYGPFPEYCEFETTYARLTSAADPLFYAIIPKSTNKPAGVASYLRIEPNSGVIEIGHICLAPSLQRTREATEGLFLMMRHVLDELGYRRLEWKCNALNASSCRSAERLGFTPEGVFRQHMIVKGRNRDTAWYSIIDKEWPAIREVYRKWLADDNFDKNGTQRSRLSQAMEARQ